LRNVHAGLPTVGFLSIAGTLQHGRGSGDSRLGSHFKRAPDDGADIDLVAQHSHVVDLRSPRPHLEEMAVFDVELVRCVAMGTIEAETVGPQPRQGRIVRLDAGLDHAPSLGTRKDEASHYVLRGRALRSVASYWLTIG
jgi:hypothetical protein